LQCLKRYGIPLESGPRQRRVRGEIFKNNISIFTFQEVLLLVDDVWDDIDLDPVEIPNPNKQGKVSEVVLATSYQIVCNKMKTDQSVKVDNVELIECWRAAGLTGEAGAIVAAYEKWPVILNTLVQSSLLEMRVSGFYVMHDVLRDLALRIASPMGDSVTKFLVRAGLDVRLPPIEDEWKEKKCILLILNKLNSLPEAPDCAVLSTLLLQSNGDLEIISDMFFQYMTGLGVLNLSNNGISLLPSSVGNLINLRGLYLNQCYELAMLPSDVGSLKKLEILQIKETRINFLPPEVGNSAHLICLLVSSSANHFLKIPLGLISRVSSLEHSAIVVPMNNEWWLLIEMLQ